MKKVMRRLVLATMCLAPVTTSSSAEMAPKPVHERTFQVSGKWQNPVFVTDAAAAAKLKAHPLLKLDLTVPPEPDTTWLEVKVAIQAAGLERTESPKWLLDRAPGTTGITNETLTWDATDVVAKMPDNPTWFKIELVTQGAHPRTLYVDNVRYEGGTGAAVTEKPKVAVPTLATPYPDSEKDFPGKGPARKFPFMQGERDAFWRQREKDQRAIVFVGDSLTGGWRTLTKDFPNYQVANRGVGGDTSRNVLFRFKEDVLDLNPRAIVIEIGNNDLTASGAPADMLSNLADMLALIDRERPGMPVVLCSIPPSANPNAPVKPEARQAMNQGIRQQAGERKNTYFCDLYGSLANEDGSPRLEFYFDDKLHLNDAGHGRWAALLTPTIEQLKLP